MMAVDKQAKLLEVQAARRKALDSIASLKDSVQQLTGYEMCLQDLLEDEKQNNPNPGEVTY